MKGTIIKMCGFTPSNKNHLTIEILGEENYIGNHIKTGMEVEVNELNKSVVMRSVCEPNHHNLDTLHLGCCSKCGGTRFKQTDA